METMVDCVRDLTVSVRAYVGSMDELQSGDHHENCEGGENGERNPQ